MTSEEDEFKKILASLEKPDEQELKRTSEIIYEELAVLRQDLATVKENIEPNEKLHKYWQDRIREIDETLKKARRERDSYEYKIAEAKRQARTKEEQIAIRERELARLKMLEAEQEGFRQAAQKMLEDTAGAKWREWALDHQITGAQALAFAGRGFLGDKMGLGKSLTSLIYADMLKAERLIIVAPKDVLNNFSREVLKWTKNRLIIHMVSIPKMNRDIYLQALLNSNPEQFIILVNLEAWRKDTDLLKSLINIKADCVIIDEAHNIKNERGKAFEGIEEIVYAHNQCIKCGGDSFGERRITKPNERFPSKCWYCNNCEYITWDEIEICSVKYVLPMTGTPILNRPQELWPSLYLINKKMFPNEAAFLKDYCEQICPHGSECEYLVWGKACKHPKRWKFQDGGLERFTKRVGNQFIMRNKKQAGIILPPQSVQEYELEFDKKAYNDQWLDYCRVATGYVRMINEQGEMGDLPIPAFITMLLRFRQIMVWPEGVTLKDEYGNILYRAVAKQSIKLDKATELIKTLVESGERVVLFSQFTPPLHEMQRRLNNFYLEDENKTIKTVVMDGSTPDHIREQIKINFDRTHEDSRKPKWDVLFSQYRVGGTGLNLTAATQMVITDTEWNPGRRDQAYARIDRIGQTQETTVHKIDVVSDELKDQGILLIDEFMNELMAQKEMLVDGFEAHTMGMAEKFLNMLKQIKDK